MRCGRDAHRLRTDRLELRSPTVNDVRAAIAGASDDAAQRWLGWLPENTVVERHRAVMLAYLPGRGPLLANQSKFLVAVDRASRRVAGAVEVQEDDHVGGWLVPDFRGRGLGRELFAGAIVFAHRHLGIRTVRAGAEPANTASVNALTAAGFVPGTGPAEYTLPDGRTIPTHWFQHVDDRPALCRRLSHTAS
jgi:RimJ/RimL family protein N-acetyltransferase